MAGIKNLIKKELYDIKDYTIILSTRNHVHLGQLKNITDMNYNAPMASAKELSFTIHWNEEPIISEYYDLIINEEIDEEVVKALIKKEKDIWDQVEDLKLVYVKELDEYFEIKVTYTDAADTIKAITGTSACEAELGQLNIYTTEINTEQDIQRDDYEPTKFYNETNHSASLLHRILADKASHYTIAHVDTSLMNLQRSFSIDGTSIYDFFMGECAEQFNCLFVFNSVERSISVYDLYTVCKNDDCGYRGEYVGECPKCGNTNLKYFGEDTLIYVDKENLTEEVVFETDVDSIKNCFKLEAGDDNMTAAVRALNQNGTDYIYVISEEQRRDMPEELVQKIEEYDALYASYTTRYRELLEQEYDAIDQILHYTSGMMPEVTDEQAEINATTEAAKLTRHNLSPLGLSKVTKDSKATVESALKNYAKVYVKTGYVKLEIVESTYNYNANGITTWTGNFKVTNYSNDADVVYSDTITVDIHENYQEFIEQKVLRAFASGDGEEEGSIFDVLDIKDLTKFKEALKKYCLRRLASFYDAIQTGLDVLVQVDQASDGADLYEVLYLPYYDKLQACQEEIDARYATISEWESIQEQVVADRAEIQKELNFENYLGDLYPVFSAYRREDKYSNTNFISDGLSNTEIFENAQEFLDTAKKELEKSATRQHSISTTLQNLLLMPEFQPLLDKFELGNWIRVGVGNNVYRLRLIRYSVNLSDLSKIEVEFSDLTKVNSYAGDVKDILSSAQSMATSYSYVSKQATKGKDAEATIKNWTEEGLNSALINLKNNDTEDITIDRHGILCKSLDEMTETYSPKQARITGNIWAFTKDNWKTVCTALGEHNYVYYDKNKEDFVTQPGYGLTSEFMQSGWIYGSHIIAGDIYSRNYSAAGKTGSYMNLDDGSFSFGGAKIVYDADKNNLSLNNVDIDWSFSTAPEIKDIYGLKDNLESHDARISANANNINLKVNATDLVKEINNQINIGTDAITISGNKFIVESTNFSVSADGTVTAKKGNVGGWDINSSQIYKVVNLYGDMSATGFADLEDNDPVQYWVWIRRPADSTTPVFGIYYKRKVDYLAGNDTVYRIFAAYTNGEVVSHKFKSNNVEITGGTLKVGSNFEVTNTGKVTANSFNSNNAKITGGSFSIDKSDFDFDVLTLNSDDYMINFSSNSLEIFCKYNNRFVNLDCYGLDCGTFEGSSPHSSGFSMLYGMTYYDYDKAKITGTLTVTGTKSRLATTENYNERLLYCYETPSPMFGDLGEGQIDETGKCYVFLDDIFAETIDTNCTYQVFLQSYGKGECYVTERTSSYFVVEGTINLNFGWELKAIQKDYDTLRLEESDEKDGIGSDSNQTLYETSMYLDSLLYNVEREEF